MDNINTTRQKILDAAIDVFSSKGYHNSRVDEIVELSKTSKGAVYFHFPSKQDIFLGLVDEFSNILEVRMKDAVSKENSGVRKVNIALQICLHTFGKYQRLAKIFLVQAVGLGVAFEKRRQEIHNRFVHIIERYLDEAVRDGDIPAIDTKITAMAWMGAINEVVISCVYSGELDPDRILPVLRKVLLRSIGIDDERIEKLNSTPG